MSLEFEFYAHIPHYSLRRLIKIKFTFYKAHKGQATNYKLQHDKLAKTTNLFYRHLPAQIMACIKLLRTPHLGRVA